MTKTTVFLSDGKILFREGIHFVLSNMEDIEVIGESTSNEEALFFIEMHKPQMAILSVDDKKLSGIEATRRIKGSERGVSVILVMDTENEEELFSAIKCGADGCITRDADPDDLVRIVYDVAEGLLPISGALLRPELAARALHEFRTLTPIEQRAGNALFKLTPSETEILREISNGAGIEDLSARLAETSEAICSELELIMQKLVANHCSRQFVEVLQSLHRSSHFAK